MDPHHFDTLVRSLTTGSSRRRVLGVLSALPLVGTALVGSDEEAKAKRTHKTRSKDHGTGPEATSCARQCRTKASKQARRRCRKRCQIPPECTTSADCPTGELCESGVCLPLPDQCATNTDCDQCERCDDGVCVPQCQPDQVCRNGQCETVQCTADRECGDCSRCVEGRCLWQCTVTEVCLSGAGGRCCQPRWCPAGTNCGTVDDGCGGTVSCGGTCSGATPVCSGDNVCVPCSGTNPCPDGGCCTSDGSCLATGATCDDGNPCTTGETCSNGTCGGGTPVADGACCNSNTGICVGGHCAPLDRCGGRCNATITLCGQTVTCPSCSPGCSSLCNSGAVSGDGPGGPGGYCYPGPHTSQTCTAAAECDPGFGCFNNTPFTFRCSPLCAG